MIKYRILTKEIDLNGVIELPEEWVLLRTDRYNFSDTTTHRVTIITYLEPLDILNRGVV